MANQEMNTAAIDAGNIAELARLELSNEEKERLGAQLNDILNYVEQLKKVDITNVEPMAHAVPQLNVTRPDLVKPSLPQADALRNAPATADGLFIVPKIVE